MDVEKEKFYDDLQTALDRTPKSDTVIVLDDTNAKLGKEDVYNEVSGKHTLHELSNRNGEMLLEFALGNNPAPNFNTRRFTKVLGWPQTKGH